ncbi:MAG: amylo-alpha-1,6-glucosidase [Chloroflexota bacterium]|nr:amylo-alpha-1,6-glucosidase [Chloroflexota bacterium]
MSLQPEPERLVTRTPEEPPAEVVEIGDRYYVLAASSAADHLDRVLKHGESFAVFDQYGDIRPVHASDEGIYHEGTRFLSGLQMRLAGQRPLLLSSTAKRDNSRVAVDLTNPDIGTEQGGRIGHGSVYVARTKVLWDGQCQERLVARNFALSPIEIPLTLRFAADFVDIFEVRGMQRPEHGKMLEPVIGKDHIVLGYEGLDGVVRRTRLVFSESPLEISEQSVTFLISLDPLDALTVDVSIICEIDRRRPQPLGFDQALNLATGVLPATRERSCRVKASNELFNDWVDRSLADLAMMTTETPEGPFPYAGVPWFSTPFGRDSLVTALECLWLQPELARGVLRFLAANQADELDPLRDAEPGKILHEMRQGEMAALGEIPFGRYYGSADATPLFVMLAAAHYRNTGDRELVKELWPNIRRALDWIDRYGDIDGDGFVEYQRQSASGLSNQGWKDSVDSVFHADGTIPRGPIALCEVQGYVFAAKRGAAEMALVIGDTDLADTLLDEADQLQDAFEEEFWSDELGTYAIALDGNKRPCLIRSSNVGHCLFTGIVKAPHARQAADALMAENSFSGWGVRTVPSGQIRYNPMSYHDGSVWPHDNALIAAGLARYGMQEHAIQILAGMFDASIHVDLARLPELFCGFSRRVGEGPTLYPVACSPQAWASAAVFMLLQACLGLEIDGVRGRVTLAHARLPAFVDDLQLHRLRVGDGSVDLLLTRQEGSVGVNVLHRDGSVEVAATLR